MSSCFILCDGDFSMILAAARDRREILLSLPRDQDDGDLRKPRRIPARACGRISISYGVAARGLGVARLVNRLAKFAAIDFGFFADQGFDFFWVVVPAFQVTAAEFAFGVFFVAGAHGGFLGFDFRACRRFRFGCGRGRGWCCGLCWWYW